MNKPYSRRPRHVGIIPDGNRRWAEREGMAKEEGYAVGAEKGKELFQILYELGVDEVTVYAFTIDNTKRRKHITDAYITAVMEFLDWVKGKDVSILAVGNRKSKMFPAEFEPFIVPEPDRDQKTKINFLVNYDWHWDIAEGANNYRKQFVGRPFDPYQHIPSRHISRIDLLIRWGGMNRLSGFPPVQTVYSDIYVIDDYWPDFKEDHIHEAMEWYQTVDVTLGG